MIDSSHSEGQVSDSDATVQAAFQASNGRRLALVMTAVVVYVAGLSLMLSDVFMDDAYIGFRYVDNLIHGSGLVFNPPERVEGVTNVGWLLLLAPLAALTSAPLAAKILSAVLVLITAWLCSRIALRLYESPSAALIVLPLPILVVTHSDFLFFSLSGMETSLLAAGLLVIVHRVMRDCGSVLTAVLAAALVTVRPEMVLFLPLFLLLTCGFDPQAWWTQRWAIVAFGVILALLTAGRYAYYGDLLPNTFVAKTAEIGTAGQRFYDLLRGRNFNVSVPVGGVVALPYLITGTWMAWTRHRRAAAALLSALLVGVFFGIYANVDWTNTGRYFAPYLPAAMLLFWPGFVEISRRVLAAMLSERLLNRVLVALAVALAAPGVVTSVQYALPAFEQYYPGYVMTSRPLLEPIAWIRDELPDDAVIATRRIGALAYLSGKHVFDYKFGLTEREVARLIRANKKPFDDPDDPALREVWMRVKPDYLLEDNRVIDSLLLNSGAGKDRFEVHGLPYRVLRRFNIAEDIDWILCERVR